MANDQSYDLLIRGGQCASTRGITRADVGIRDGKIAAVGDLSAAAAAEVFDAEGLHLLPGVIDTQVHLREPGAEHKEDLETGTAAAVSGGVCAVFEMPNTSPPTTTVAAIRDKLERARGRAWCDHAFYAGASPENVAELPALEALPGCCGVKMFMGSSTGSLLVPDDPTVSRVLASGRRRMAVHAEDEERLKERFALVAGGAAVSQHPVWRDAECALRATQRVLKLARAARRPVHILHVTTADEMAVLAGAKDIASVECTPQHLTLAAPECYERLGTLAQMNPPIRDARHRDALWEALRGGVVDVIGSDHAPHTLEEKGGSYPATPSGMTGVQTLLPLMLDHCHQGRLSLERLVELTSANAARLFGIAGKGALEPGFDADVTVVDLEARRTITNSWIRSRCGWTPFDGLAVHGWPVATIIRGRTVMREGDLLGSPTGLPLHFAC